MIAALFPQPLCQAPSAEVRDYHSLTPHGLGNPHRTSLWRGRPPPPGAEFHASSFAGEASASLTAGGAIPTSTAAPTGLGPSIMCDFRQPPLR